MKPFVVRTSFVLAAAALAFSLTFGGTSAARADEPQTVILEGQEMTLVPVQSIEAMQKRIAYLEETVNSLTEAWQHIDTHHLCVSDLKDEDETCISKRQLDKLLALRAPATEASAASPAPATEASVVSSAPVAEVAPPKVEPVESVATVEATEPPPAVIASEAQEPEHTGSITPAAAPSSEAPAPVEEAAQKD
jgi:TolA-binding protein